MTLNNSTMETQETSIQDFEDFFADDVNMDSTEEQSETQSEEHYEESEHDESEESATDDEYEDETSTDDDNEEEEESTQESALDIDESEFEIVVDGEPLLVKGSELKNGYMRQSAFTKKTQELAKEREQVQAKMNEVAQQAQVVMFQAKKKIGEFDTAIQQAGGWDKIRMAYSPEDVQKFTDMYVAAQKEAAYADGLINEYSEQIRQENYKALQSTFKNMIETVNNFSVDTVKEMVKYAQDSGYDESFLETITDPVSWGIIHKAMLFDKAQAKSKNMKDEQTKTKVNGKRHHPNKSVKSEPNTSKQNQIKRAVDKQKNAKSKRANEQASFEAFEQLFK